MACAYCLGRNLGGLPAFGIACFIPLAQNWANGGILFQRSQLAFLSFSSFNLFDLQCKEGKLRGCHMPAVQIQGQHKPERIVAFVIARRGFLTGVNGSTVSVAFNLTKGIT